MEYLVGILLPPVIDYVNRVSKTQEEKTIITIVVCLLVACLLDWKTISTGTSWDSTHVLTLAAVLIAEATTVYNLYWKKSDARVLLPGNGVTAPQE